MRFSTVAIAAALAVVASAQLDAFPKCGVSPPLLPEKL